MQLCTATQIREFDRQTILAGTPGTVLMERAGQHVCDAIVQRLGGVTDREITIICGGGNNGGDGFVAARLLGALQAKVQIFLLASPDSLQGDVRCNFERLTGVQVTPLLDDERVAAVDIHGDLIVDSLLGTGLSRVVTGRFALMIERLNQSGVPVLAVDIPSGLDADSGQVLGRAVRADSTVTFQVQKIGMVQFPAREYVGQVSVVDIGITPELLSESQLPTLISNSEAMGLFPQRMATGHKGSFGHVLLVAGSLGKTGAAILSGLGCLRSGVGLVSLCVPERLNQTCAMSLIEAMTIPVTGQDGICFHNHDFGLVVDESQGKGCVVLGPGLGQAETTRQLLNQLVSALTNPMLIDADGLNLLSSDSLKSLAGRKLVLTPHPGEMARLTGKTVAEIQANRVQAATSFAEEFGVVLVLKGAATVIAGPGGKVAINSTGNPGMGTGGMGDVLSGIIATFMARGLDPFSAACLGVYSHGRAGDLLVESGMSCGYLASELADALPDVWQELGG